MLRLVTSDDMTTLDEFLGNPTPFNGSRLISIPVIYQMLRSEVSNEGEYSQAALELVGMIRDRAREVLGVLVDHGAGLSKTSEMGNVGDQWQQVRVGVLQLLSPLK